MSRNRQQKRGKWTRELDSIWSVTWKSYVEWYEWSQFTFIRCRINPIKEKLYSSLSGTARSVNRLIRNVLCVRENEHYNYYVGFFFPNQISPLRMSETENGKRRLHRSIKNGICTFSRRRTKPEVVIGRRLENSHSHRLIQPNKSEVSITVILAQ